MKTINILLIWIFSSLVFTDEINKIKADDKSSRSLDLQQVNLQNNPPMPQAPMIFPQKTKAVYNYNSFPLDISNPFNLQSFPNIFNPNQSHLTGASPLHVSAMGLHPFMASGMSLPFMNPYMMMNPMMMGAMGGANSLHPLNIPGTAPFYNVNDPNGLHQHEEDHEESNHEADHEELNHEGQEGELENGDQAIERRMMNQNYFMNNYLQNLPTPFDYNRNLNQSVNDKGFKLNAIVQQNLLNDQKEELGNYVGIEKNGLSSFYDQDHPQDSMGGIMGSVGNGLPFDQMNEMLKNGIKPRDLHDVPIV